MFQEIIRMTIEELKQSLDESRHKNALLRNKILNLESELKQEKENYIELAKDYDTLEKKYFDAEHNEEINKQMQIENIRLRNALIKLVLRIKWDE